MKSLLPLFLAAFVFAGCDNAEQEAIEQRKDTMQESLDEQAEVVNDAASQAKEQLENNEVAQDVVDQQQEATQKAIETEKETIDQAAEAAKERAE